MDRFFQKQKYLKIQPFKSLYTCCQCVLYMKYPCLRRVVYCVPNDLTNSWLAVSRADSLGKPRLFFAKCNERYSALEPGEYTHTPLSPLYSLANSENIYFGGLLDISVSDSQRKLVILRVRIYFSVRNVLLTAFYELVIIFAYTLNILMLLVYIIDYYKTFTTCNVSAIYWRRCTFGFEDM